jgi:hypothetical protein
VKLTSMSIERRYSDDSGVEFGVSANAKDITFERISKVDFPLEELDWLIACLVEIKARIAMESDA